MKAEKHRQEGDKMEIKKDDSFRKLSFFESRYADLCTRAENYSAEIPEFDAAKRFFRDHFDIHYVYQSNSVWSCFLGSPDEAQIYFNGATIAEVTIQRMKEKNMQLFPVAYVKLRKGFVRYILINENSEFFLDDGTYLGADYEDVVARLLREEISIAPIRNDQVYTSLERRGWAADKKIDTADIEAEYTKRGFHFIPSAKRFFETIPCGKYTPWNEGQRSDPPYIGIDEERRIKDPYELRNKIGEDLLNIGGTRNEFYYISESGMFYAETDVSEPFAVTDDIYLFMQWVLSR